MQTREQVRMDKTWLVLTTHFGNEPELWKKRSDAQKYLNQVRKTPARIHASGLGQAIAFLKSHKAEKVATDISRITLEMLGTANSDNLLSKLRSNDAAFLFLATDEAMAICGWLARYLAGAGVKPEESDAPTKISEQEPDPIAASTGEI